MTTTPGYLVTITAFLPADPQSPREMAIAAAMLDNLDEHLEAMGLQERVVSPRFVQRHRISSAPPAQLRESPTIGTQAELATQAPDPAAGAAILTIGDPPGSTSSGSTDLSQLALAGTHAASEPYALKDPADCAHPIIGEHPERGRHCIVCRTPMPAEAAA